MKPDRTAVRVTANLDVLRFPVPSKIPAGVTCLNCSARLVLHQPDEDAPERLLGVCAGCRHWFLLDLLPDLTEGVMVRLPDIQVIRELSREDPSHGISLMGPDPGEGSALPHGSGDVPGRSPRPRQPGPT